MDDGSLLAADPLRLEGRLLYGFRARVVITESTVVGPVSPDAAV
jgi:hypothetical protein